MTCSTICQHIAFTPQTLSRLDFGQFQSDHERLHCLVCNNAPSHRPDEHMCQSFSSFGAVASLQSTVVSCSSSCSSLQRFPRLFTQGPGRVSTDSAVRDWRPARCVSAKSKTQLEHICRMADSFHEETQQTADVPPDPDPEHDANKDT